MVVLPLIKAICPTIPSRFHCIPSTVGITAMDHTVGPAGYKTRHGVTNSRHIIKPKLWAYIVEGYITRTVAKHFNTWTAVNYNVAV